MDTIHLIFVSIVIGALACRGVAQCPGLEPPVNGVLRCQEYTQGLQCTATCYSGLTFATGERVVERTCISGATQWLEGGGQIPDCRGSCDVHLLSAPGKVVTTSSSRDAEAVTSHPDRLPTWLPATDNILQYIQVDLGSPHVIKGWRVRGDGTGSYVILFRLLFSLDGTQWAPYTDGDVYDKFFLGNFDSSTAVTEMLSAPQTARFVRFNPLSWQRHIALGWDLIGCPIHAEIDTVGGKPGQAVCKAPLPPTNGAVNCERNGTQVVCTAYCRNNLVFNATQSPALDLPCDPLTGRLPREALPPCVERTSTNPAVNITGQCFSEERDCFHVGNGNYQYCGDCHFFSTCSEGFFFVRPCPEHLRYDSRLGLCNYHSDTCDSKQRALYKMARARARARAAQDRKLRQRMMRGKAARNRALSHSSKGRMSKGDYSQKG